MSVSSSGVQPGDTQRTDSPESPSVGEVNSLDSATDFWDAKLDQMSIMNTVQMIGSAVIAIAVITIVVNQVLTTGAVQNTSGPFDPIIDRLGTTGVAAMSLLVIGLLVAAASQLMGFMRGGF